MDDFPETTTLCRLITLIVLIGVILMPGIATAAVDGAPAPGSSNDDTGTL